MKARTSLSAKILFLALWNLLLLGVTLVALAGVQLQNLSSLLLAPTRDRILADARLLALELTQTPEASRDKLLDKHTQARGVAYHLYSAQGLHVAGPPLMLPPIVHARVIQNSLEESFFVTTRDPTTYWVGVRIPIGSPGGEDPLRGVLVLGSDSLFGNAYFLDLALVGLVLLVVITVSVACWVPLIRGLTRGLSQISLAAGQIAEGRFDIKVPSDRHDELGQLAASINQMAGRLGGFVQGQKRFLGDIAHELCSPIARAQFALGILEQRAGDSQIEYVNDVREEIEHMTALVTELLLFSKAGMQPAQIKRVPVNLGETVQRALSREADGAAQFEVVVSSELKVLADPEYLLRSLSNLIRNSIRYAGDSGPIRISAKGDEHEVLITVADLGPGLPHEALEQIFTPFYRPEPARTRETGGVGLGLAIVKTCIEACKGTVRCINLEPRGLSVEIRLASAN